MKSSDFLNITNLKKKSFMILEVLDIIVGNLQNTEKKKEETNHT